MGKRFRQAAVVFVVVLGGAQFIRPDQTNPATDPKLKIGAQDGKQKELVAILDRACSDCHSNATVWPSFAKVAPLSWAMAYAVKQGRKAVNFSEWAVYAPERQKALLAASCQDATQGKMPGAYTLLRSETTVAPHDVETICAAAR